MLRSLAEASCTPAEVLTKLNGLLVDDFPSGKFVTMVYAVLDPATRTLTFANAGHLSPLLVTNGSEIRFLETVSGLPLGVTCGSFSETTVHLPEGSRLLFYSDGITEAANQEEEEYGEGRLKDHVLNANLSNEGLLEDVRQFVNGVGLQDDATAILISSRL
jgi:sigma-B regulation protein RsbU (phosphoserine phosphatase)